MAGLVEVAAPSDEPVTLAEAKTHLRITGTDEDTYIEDFLIPTARQRLERATGRAFITTTFDLYRDDFPSGDELTLPRPPLQSVTSVKYTPEGDSQTTFSSDNYLVDTSSKYGGRLKLKRTVSWPSQTLDVLNGVVIRFVAGYGDASTDVPAPIVQAVYVDIATLYENRENVELGRAIAFHQTVERLIAPYSMRLLV